MGFHLASCQALIHARKRLGVDFARCLTLGRQEIFLRTSELRGIATAQGVPATDLAPLDRFSRYAEPWFEILGAQSVESMDASDYEQATIIHDLNSPVPVELHGRFSCVVDGGTIEHVFHFPNAIRSCMDMLEVGGHYLALTPGNNQMGHGFYQFSPELYFRLFCAENGFEMRTMMVRAAKDWYEVTDPKVLGERIELVNAAPVTLFIVARKTRQVGTFHTPQQSDYVSAWSSGTTRPPGEAPPAVGQVRSVVRKVLPTRLKTLLRRAQALARPVEEVEGLGTIDPRHYRRMEL